MAAKKSKRPEEADYGLVEIDGKEYEFMRRKDEYFLRRGTEGDKVKIILKSSRRGRDIEWLPTEIYYVHADGNRHVGQYGGISSRTYLDRIKSDMLTRAVRANSGRVL